MEFGFGPRFGAFVIAAAILFVALRVHKSSGKHSRISKPTGVILAFIAGLGFLTTIVGAWMGQLAGFGGTLGVAGLIACIGIVAVDWGLDGRPDKPAFFAALLLPMFIVFGMAQFPAVADQIGSGGQQVTEQMSRVGR
ncbi:hypothetical protein [Melissospora conviva]|uniref:hypothetical protein n=1 Tax=Melissospora conviva TaxID=3388432 RepID=UPI003C1C3358